MPDVSVVDVTLRDGLQDYHAFVPTSGKAKVLAALDRAGLDEIEFTAFVSPRAIPPLADAAGLAASWPARTARTGLSALVPNVRGVERAVAAGVRRVLLASSATDSFAWANLNRDLAGCLEQAATAAEVAAENGVELRVGISVAFGCPFEGPVSPARVLELIAAHRKAGIEHFNLADTIGAAEPLAVASLVRAALKANPGLDVGIHLHGAGAPDQVVPALEAGATRVEAALGGLGGCPYAPGAPGNLDLEQLIGLLDASGIKHGVDRKELAQAHQVLDEALGQAERQGEIAWK